MLSLEFCLHYHAMHIRNVWPARGDRNSGIIINIKGIEQGKLAIPLPLRWLSRNLICRYKHSTIYSLNMNQRKIHCFNQWTKCSLWNQRKKQCACAVSRKISGRWCCRVYAGRLLLTHTNTHICIYIQSTLIYLTATYLTRPAIWRKRSHLFDR